MNNICNEEDLNNYAEFAVEAIESYVSTNQILLFD